jgi:hypothetical protein
MGQSAGGTSFCKHELEIRNARQKSFTVLERSLTMKSTNLKQQPENNTPWTARDIRRLKAELRAGTSIPHLAVQLQREIGEVRAKVDELTRQYLAERAAEGGVASPRRGRL